MVAVTRDADDLKMLAWDNSRVTASDPAAHAPQRHCPQCPGEARVAESPSRESLIDLREA